MPELLSIPLLHDRHSHVSFYASLLGCPSLAGLGLDAAKAALATLPKDRLSVVLGWHSARAPFSGEELRRLPPAILVNVSMHGCALAGEAADMLADSQPELVAHWTDPAWSESHLPHLLETFSRTAGLTARKLEAFMDGVEALGLSAVDDMLLPGEEAFQLIRRSRWADTVQCWTSPETFRTLSPASREAVTGFKLFTDGALGTRTAALKEAFLDGRKGLLLHKDEALMRILGDLQGMGKPVALHAIGDAAIEQSLDILERLDRDGLRFPKVRLEHVQFIDRPQAKRTRNLGVVLSMQPNFNSDSRDYADRLAPAWLERNNPFRMLIDEAGFVPGEDLILGSDGMPHGVEYALQWCLFPAYACQRLTVEELVAGYGVSAAETGTSVLEVDRTAERVRLIGASRR